MKASTLPAPELSPAPALARKPDFATWLPPMLVKELRQGLRTRGFVVTLIGFQLLMVVMLGWGLLVDVSGLANGFNTVNGVFWSVLGTVLLLITPVRGLSALRDEVEGRTIDLLMLTRLTAWRIVLGKWSSLVVQGALLALAMLPYGVARYFFGAVNLVDDFGTMAAMLGGCALATGATLLASSLPKIVRVLLPIGLVVMVQSSGVFLLGGRMGVRMFGGSSSTGATALTTSLWVFNGAVVLVFLLASAVRRLAPPAENHSVVIRCLPVILLLPAVLLKLFGVVGVANVQVMFALAAIFLVSGIELARHIAPQAVQWRPWWSRGAAGRIAGRFFLPGWQSAALFTTAALAIAALVASWTGFPERMPWTRGVWWLGLAWVALVFPTLIIASIAPARRLAGAGYLILQGVFGIISILSATHMAGALQGRVAQLLEHVSRVLPISSFWLGSARAATTAFAADEWVPQLALGLAVAAYAFWLSRSHWATLASFSDRLARPVDVGSTRGPGA